MATIDLIDTTEMYLKTILELEEDGVTPMRARIVERLGHSGPTVSQTIARMERDGLVTVGEDRRLSLTDKGREIAREVMRKHRLAECLLVSIIGMEWDRVHEEACRWEHVMSHEVEQRINVLLSDPLTDPYGNPIPGTIALPDPRERSAEELLIGEEQLRATITRIGEPIQAEPDALRLMAAEGIGVGSVVGLRRIGEFIEIWLEDSEQAEGQGAVRISTICAPHLFLV